MPFILIGVIVFFLASLCVWRDNPARELRFRCDGCGYLLKGQETPRCPECGRRFDPARLTF
jgi:rubrerythrin